MFRMKWAKSQITSTKLQINLKFQNSNPKQIQKTMNQIDSVVYDKLHSACLRLGLRPKITHPRPELGSRVRHRSNFVWVIGTWDLVIVVICCLVLVIFIIQRCFFFYKLFDFLNVFMGHNASLCPSSYRTPPPAILPCST